MEQTANSNVYYAECFLVTRLVCFVIKIKINLPEVFKDDVLIKKHPEYTLTNNESFFKLKI